MMIMNKFFSQILAFAAFALAGAALPSSAAGATGKVDHIVAVVNNEVITALQLRERLAQFQRQLQRQGAQPPPDDTLERQLLEQMIVEQAQLQLARATSLQVDDAMLERAIARIAAANQLSPDELKAALTQDGIGWERFIAEVRTGLILNRLREREVDTKVSVTDAEIANFIRANPDAFSGIEYRIAHILLRTPEDENEVLVARAEKVLARLAAGEDFAKVAADSSDASDAPHGGDLGWRDREHLPGIYAEAVASLQVGEMAPVLRSTAGVHIIKLLGKREGEGAGTRRTEQTRVRHILIKTSEILSDADAEARLLALRERIVNGADFGELAKASSADLSAPKGGDLGWINPGDTVPEFERAMNTLQPGKLSPPVRSPFGWHLIEVLERRIQDTSDEHKRNNVRAVIHQRKADEAYEEWSRQLRDSTYVEYRLDTE
jgi:peptidyl-prolyl cis-trans isomerase SurA